MVSVLQMLAVLALASADGKPATEAPRVVHPAPIEDGVAWVREANTGWDPRLGVYRVFFRFPRSGGQRPVVGAVPGEARATELVQQWCREGTAAGNHGDVYDNRDDGHSMIAPEAFPQISRIAYDPFFKQPPHRRHGGLQQWFLYNVPVIGNSSSAQRQDEQTLSHTRFAMLDARRIHLQSLHYLSNQLYVYPEHRDYDLAGGDRFPANTPYVITSQGSSGSDRPFVNALALTLAAFNPATKQVMMRKGVWVPTVQQILRHSYDPREGGTDIRYLSGAAHPVVFDAKRLDVTRMVQLAHALKPDNLPPVALLQVQRPVMPSRMPAGMTFEAEQRFATPAAVAHVYHRDDPVYAIELSGAGSRDLNDRPLSYHWVVLQGDATAIRIEPMDPASQQVRLTIPRFEPFPVSPGSAMLTRRVDIGLFVSNGTHYSAPAFFSLYMPPGRQEAGGKAQELKD